MLVPIVLTAVVCALVAWILLRPPPARAPLPGGESDWEAKLARAAAAKRAQEERERREWAEARADLPAAAPAPPRLPTGACVAREGRPPDPAWGLRETAGRTPLTVLPDGRSVVLEWRVLAWPGPYHVQPECIGRLLLDGAPLTCHETVVEDGRRLEEPSAEEVQASGIASLKQPLPGAWDAGRSAWVVSWSRSESGAVHNTSGFVDTAVECVVDPAARTARWTHSTRVWGVGD